ncbi:hypothetical protein HWV62_34403, partial [Athelia sp. TMB]
YVIVWIMSQRILIRIQNVADSSTGDTRYDSVATPAPYPTTRRMTNFSLSPVESAPPSPPIADGEKSLENYEGDVENQQRIRKPAVGLNDAL